MLPVLALLIIAPASLGSAKPTRDRCVVSQDGVVLHHPSRTPCNAEEQQGMAREEKTRKGEANDLDFATEIPPGNPYIPTNPQSRAGNGPLHPVEIGTRIVYRHSLTRTLYTDGLKARVVRYRGDRREEILPAAESHGAARYEIRTTDRLRGEVGNPDIHETQRHYVIPNATAYELAAS
jgi:hypothetical protein